MWASIAVVLVAVGAAVSSPAHARPRDHHWGVNLTTTEIISSFGYPTEIHHVTTEDGYILELHRVPYGVAGPSGEPRPPVFLQHCLLCSSADFIMDVPGKALVYMLADAGYDVWLGNFRGNTYSRNHTSLDPEHLDFWKFSWDEHALYDLPAAVDYVLAATGEDSLYYCGWSMGTTTFFALMSDKPEYNAKIRAMAAMAPVTFMDHADGPIMALAPYSGDVDMVLTLLGVGELLPSSDVMDWMAETYCDMNATTAQLCYNFLFMLAGPDPDNVPKEFLPVILAHTPAGSSVHTVNHYAQLVLSGRFEKYDYGYLGNMNHYGQAKPPPFDLTNVAAPVGLFWGQTDWLADPTDVARLAESLPNLALNHRVDKDQFNHLDFGWGIDADVLVYRHILDFFAAH